MMEGLSFIQKFVVWAPPVVFAITLHEVAHGWVAKQFGDQTAWKMGRLTLNPVKHIDLIGTILIPGILLLSFSGFIFGWAKPVPVDIRNLKNPKRDMAIIALAGPVSNMIMAIGWTLIIRIGVLIDAEFISMPLIFMGVAGISINLVLALLNLLPIPPLDGSRIMSGLLPDKIARQYNRLERFGFIILLVLLVSGSLTMVLGYPLYAIQNMFFTLAGL